MGKIAFSVFTKPWKELPIPQLAQMVKGWGFDGIEFPLRTGFQVEPANAERGLRELVRQLADYGLKVYSVASDPTEPVFAACADNGIPLIRVMAPVDHDYLVSEARIRRDLEQQTALCGKYGVKIGVQEHCGDNVSDATGLLRLVESFDPRHIGAVWDAGHDALAGQQPEIGLNIVWSHLAMVNFKNAFYLRTNGPEAYEAKWSRYFTTGRNGLASWPRAVRHLLKRDYSGVVCLTAQYEAKDQIAAYVAEDLAYLKSLFGN